MIRHSPIFHFSLFLLVVIVLIFGVRHFLQGPDYSEEAKSWPQAEATLTNVVKRSQPLTEGSTSLTVQYILRFEYYVDAARYEISRHHYTSLDSRFPHEPDINAGDSFTLRYSPDDHTKIYYLDNFPRLR